MNQQLRSVARLLAALVMVAGTIVAGAGGAAAQPVRAGDASVHLMAKARHVSIHVARRVPVGAKVKITGTVSPPAPHQRVKLKLRSAGAWHTVHTKKLSASSAYGFSQRLTTTGNRHYRVVVPRHGTTHKIKSKARTVSVTTPGNDVSYPQCGGALPAGSTFGIVGVDGGRPFDANPCLEQEIAWAAAAGSPAYYANTANPRPKQSTHWPKGQRSPKVCDAKSPKSAECSFDYGWNAAKDSYARAATAAASAGAPAVSGATWWLDVESGNSWQSDTGQTAAHLANDTAALKGMRKYLRAKGVDTVGVYSTSHQWQEITGGASLHKAPVWYAGVGGASSAAAHCASAFSFTGGPVEMTQFSRGGFDADNRC